MASRVRDLLTLMEQVSGREFTLEHLPGRPFDAPYSVLDISKAGDLGWAPAIPLDEVGLARTWAWLTDLDEDQRR